MEKKFIFDLIKNEVFGIELPLKTKQEVKGEVLPRLYKLSKIHDLAHIISASLYKNGMLEKGSNAYNAFIKEQQLSVLRYEQINHELIAISEIFEQNQIPFIPLKGSVLRDYYKEPWQRTSCDIDILIKKEDVNIVTKFLVEKYGYVQTYKTEHDVSFTTVGGVHLELHFKLIEGRKTESVLKTVWQNVVLKQGKKYQYLMTDEMYYFYHLAHMAKHFEEGGCGIRTFLDLYIMQNNMPVNKGKLNILLEKGGLVAFYEASKKLANAWFGDGETDELIKQMEDFILGAGVYGNVENRVAVNQGRKGGKIRYVFHRIFLPYSRLKGIYPVLEKHKILTPFCGIHRWFKILFGGRAKKAVNEIKISTNLDQEKLERTKKLMCDLDL